MFVGRSQLLDELVAAAKAAVAGSGAVVLLTGEAGIGKTTVVRALAQSVRDELTVSWGNCIADRGAPPFWPWRAVVTAAEASGNSVSGDSSDSAIGAERFERLNDFRVEVLRDARASPRLHVIEDLQWADVASVLLLGHVGVTIAEAPLMIVATLRTGEPMSRQLDDAVEAVRRGALVRTVPSLREEEVAELVREAGVSLDEELAALIRRRTGGNPLFVTELLRTSQSNDADAVRRAVDGSVPSRLSELVAHRLTRLSNQLADFVAVASVVGREGDARALAAAAGATVHEAVELIDEAQVALLFEDATPGRWQFRHDLVRDAVYETLGVTTKARLHAAVFDALAADAATPPPVLAGHALAAQPLFDAERAVALAARAGEHAFDRHAYEEAITWFDRALAAAPTDAASRWRAELLVLRGEAQRHIGEIGEARSAFVEAAELTGDPALLARAALGYTDPGLDLGVAYRSEDPVTRVLLDRAIAAQADGDSAAVVALETRYAAVLYFSEDPRRARELAQSALERARRLGDRRALGVATALIHDAFVVGQSPLEEQLRGSAQLLDWARETGSAAALLSAHRARVFDLLSAGDIAGVDAQVLAFRQLAEPLRVPGYDWWVALWSAMRALLEGRHDLAESRALAAFGTSEGAPPTMGLLNLSFLLFFLRREQGRLAEMEQMTRDYVSSYADIPAIRAALIFLLAELDRADEARGMLAAIDDPMLARLRDRNWPAAWFQLARAAMLVADRDLAKTLLEDRYRPSERCVTVSLATVCLGAADLATAWLLHAVGDLDAADETYAAAASVNARIGARSWLAQTHVDHARLLLDRAGSGDAIEARRLANLAAAEAEQVGLAAIERDLETLRRRLDLEPSTTPVPTPSALFRRAGETWRLSFASREVQIPDSRGLADIAHLLSRAGESVSVLELLDEPDASPAGATRGAPALDERARRAIRERMHELDDEIAEAERHADGERAALAREKLQQLAESVARDVGLGGRSRRIGDPVERARKTVSTRIRRAIAQIGRAHPELGRHLERSIDTGAWCAYRPAEPVTWNT